MKYVAVGLFIVGILILIVYGCKIVYRYEMYDIAVINVNSKIDMIMLNQVQFRPGDLILFRYDCSKCNKTELINRIITINPWPNIFSHIGLVTQVDGILYIAHKTFCEESDYKGNCIVNKSGLYPLYKYIKEYNGDVYHCQLQQPIDIQKLNEKIDYYNEKKFVVDSVSVFDYLLGTDIHNRKNNTMSCSGYVYHLLKDVDLIKSNKNGNHLTPGDVYQEVYQKYAQPRLILRPF